jgi:hypothetical protein
VLTDLRYGSILPNTLNSPFKVRIKKLKKNQKKS